MSKRITKTTPSAAVPEQTFVPPLVHGPNVVMISLWANDGASSRRLEDRAAHLLAKTSVERWVWVVDDSSRDDTDARLRAIAEANTDKNIVLVFCKTGIIGDTPSLLVQRKSIAFSAGLDTVQDTDTYWVLHESDLISPVDVVDQFLASELCPVAGWVTLGEGGIFYDTWGYRADGQLFSNHAPYSHAYNPTNPFQVSSVGSCFMMHAEDLRAGVRCERLGVVELCQQLRERGRSIWVIPTLPIVQPRDLWQSRGHA